MSEQDPRDPEAAEPEATEPAATEPEATQARLALVAATAMVIRSGLRVMGVTPVEEMR